MANPYQNVIARAFGQKQSGIDILDCFALQARNDDKYTVNLNN